MISSASLTPFTEGKALASKASLSERPSATILTEQFAAVKKLRTILGPQYPYPITPMLMLVILFYN
jgi:hypothetical protein